VCSSDLDREIKTVGKKLIQVYKDLMNNKI